MRDSCLSKLIYTFSLDRYVPVDFFIKTGWKKIFKKFIATPLWKALFGERYLTEGGKWEHQALESFEIIL